MKALDRRSTLLGTAAYKLCPRSRSKLGLVTLPNMSKTAACFICSKDFAHSQLTAHEKTCFETIQSNDTQYTRQNTDDMSSSRSSLHDLSVVSSNSTSSNEGSDKKTVRCYICGTDVPSYLTSIHERTCKKSWENGLLNSVSTPTRKFTDSLRSLSRCSSKTDVQIDTPTRPRFQKSKSSANIFSKVQSESLKKTPTSGSSSLLNHSKRSRSIGNLTHYNKPLAKYKDFDVVDKSPTMSKTKSLQGLDSEKRTAVPQYIECRTCGKQYSQHSIAIHSRQCEKKLTLQKNAGTNSDYKKKSKSLLDLTAVAPGRPASASKLLKTTTHIEINERPASAGSVRSKDKRSALQQNGSDVKSSLFNTPKKLTPAKLNSTPENSSKQKTPTDKPIADKKTKPTSTGFQECYLCHQLFGSRSLPIHEKQCAKKWERNLEEENLKKKKKNQKDITLVPFGKEKLSATDDADSPSLHRMDSPQTSPRSLTGKSKLDKENDNALANGVTERNNPSKFVDCLFCGKRYGQHSIQIHEKNCRERIKVEEKARERLEAKNQNKELLKSKANKNNMVKSVNGNSLSNGDSMISGNSLSNGDSLHLETCEDCHRKYLPNAIAKHRLTCRSSVS